MRFSEAYSISLEPDDDWFDPHLAVDTRLFLDPFLLLDAGEPWSTGHHQLIEHFVRCYEFVAKSTGATSLSAQAARALLTFPEPAEFALGYTVAGTRGSGSGVNGARAMADGIAVAIAAGLAAPEHIEEIGILNEGIGADHISDATINVLKGRFIEYTQEVARRHRVPLAAHQVRNARCDAVHARWSRDKVMLPTNPVTGCPVILVPSRLLNDLPTLNADDWFYSDLNADLRMQMNLGIGQRARKAEIVEFARRHPDRVRTWAREQTSRPDLRGYDFGSDPLGVVQWDREPAAFARQNPLALKQVESQAELHDLVGLIVDKFSHFVEQQGGWSLLWNDDHTEKPESAAQLLLLGLAQPYLRQFDVELDREVNLGRGVVDFKASSGTSVRVLIEVKKAHNGKFWNGLDDQLPTYLQSDECGDGWFVAIRYRDGVGGDRRMKELPQRVAECSQRTEKMLRYKWIDARPPMSASALPAPGDRQ